MALNITGRAKIAAQHQLTSLSADVRREKNKQISHFEQ
ncbi:hypothetical protein ACVI1L_005009 [Bradyrhizobium sp. USDA 4516]|nr:hypothetical protein [Bradyrhizobium sp. USDA 4541]